MKWFATVPFFTFLLITTLVYNAPLILMVWLARNRLGRIRSRSLIATGFAISIGYWVWRIEWYDIWRQGVPPARYLLSLYVPYLGAGAATGWLVGTFVDTRPSSSRRPPPQSRRGTVQKTGSHARG